MESRYDERRNNKLKKGIVATILLLSGFAGGIATARRIIKSNSNHKFENYYNVLCEWLASKQQGRDLEDYFLHNGYHSIAIYGMGGLGGLLYEELEGADVEIKYGIDSIPYYTYPGLKIVEPKDNLEAVDAIVVTPVFAFDAIKEMLSQKTTSDIVSLADVVCGYIEKS